ncbi:unnamed protein product [Leptidea sinapis]|uniref:Uncharacterized protein n=1 Tax=Leptidea sinapis TaxID=189913 RepID=A0A5E4PP68_9NEOP|nr:unnamed protein product [Leptidea sinapis]
MMLVEDAVTCPYSSMFVDQQSLDSSQSDSDAVIVEEILRTSPETKSTANADSGVDTATSQSTFKLNYPETSAQAKKSVSIALPNYNMKPSEYMEIFVTMGVIKISLYVSDDGSPEVTALRPPAVTQPQNKEADEPAIKVIIDEAKPKKSHGNTSVSSGQSLTETTRHEDMVKQRTHFTSDHPLTRKIEGIIPLINVTLHQPNLYYWRRKIHKNLQVSLFNLWVGFGTSDEACNETLLRTAQGLSDPETDIPPALATLRAEQIPGSYVSGHPARGSIQLDIERPVLLELSTDKLKRIKGVMSLIEKYVPRESKNDVDPSLPAMYKLRRCMVRNNIESIIIQTSQMGVRSEEGAGGWERLQAQMACASKPDRLISRVLIEALVITAGPSTDTRHVVLHPICLGGTFEANWESHRRVEILCTHEPRLRIAMDIDRVILDLRPQDLSVVADIRDTLKEILEPTQIVSAEQLPMAYQVTIYSDSVSWRYPHPRAITRLIAYPIPGMVFEMPPQQDYYSKSCPISAEQLSAALRVDSYFAPRSLPRLRVGVRLVNLDINVHNALPKLTRCDVIDSATGTMVQFVDEFRIQGALYVCQPSKLRIRIGDVRLATHVPRIYTLRSLADDWKRSYDENINKTKCPEMSNCSVMEKLQGRVSLWIHNESEIALRVGQQGIPFKEGKCRVKLENSEKLVQYEGPYLHVRVHHSGPTRNMYLSTGLQLINATRLPLIYKVSYNAVRAGGGCSLELQLCPAVLFANASPIAITLRSYDAAPLCKLEPGVAMCPPSVILKVALLTLYYEIKENINVLGVTSTYVLINRLNTDILVPVVVCQQIHEDRCIITIAEDPCPQYVIHNRTGKSLTVAEPTDLIIQELSTRGNIQAVEECEGALWRCVVAEGTLTHYTSPSHCGRFPPTCDVPRTLPLLTVSTVREEIPPEWCQPIVVTDGEQLLQMSGGMTIKVRVRTHPHSTLIEFLDIDQNDISASDIRRRLLGPLPSDTVLLDDDNEKENERHDFTPRGMVIMRGTVEVLRDSSLANVSAAVHHDIAASLEKAESLKPGDAKPSQSSMDLQGANYADLSEQHAWMENDRIACVIDSITVSVANSWDVRPILGLHLRRVAVRADLRNHARKTRVILTAGDVQVDNPQYEDGQYDFAVVACARADIEEEQWPPLWNIADDAFQPREDLARLMVKTCCDRWTVANNTFSGPLALYVEDAYVTAIVELVRLAMPPTRTDAEAVTEAETIYLQKPLRLRRLYLHPLDLTLTLHTAVRMYIALDQSPLRLSAFQLQDMMTTTGRLTHALTVHYLSAAILGAEDDLLRVLWLDLSLACQTLPLTYWLQVAQRKPSRLSEIAVDEDNEYQISAAAMARVARFTGAGVGAEGEVRVLTLQTALGLSHALHAALTSAIHHNNAAHFALL